MRTIELKNPGTLWWLVLIEGIADQIPERGAALQMFIEHVWLTPLHNAICAQGSKYLVHAFLILEVLARIGAELDMRESVEEE